MADKKLTKQQKRVLDFIRKGIAENGYPPTVREIGEGLGLSSSATVHTHLSTLEAKGYIKRDAAKSRSISITDIGAAAGFEAGAGFGMGAGTGGIAEGNTAPDGIGGITGHTPGMTRGWDAFGSAPDMPGESPQDVQYIQGRDVITLPLVGQVAAGSPILAEQNIEENIPLPKEIVGDSSSFILKVRGESMIEAGIFNGDYVVVKEQETAHNGEIVVALLGEEATVKTFYREPDRIRLQPENHTMDPIYTNDVRILGKVVALFRTI